MRHVLSGAASEKPVSHGMRHALRRHALRRIVSLATVIVRVKIERYTRWLRHALGLRGCVGKCCVTVARFSVDASRIMFGPLSRVLPETQICLMHPW